MTGATRPDPTRLLLAKWDLWKATVDGQVEIVAYRALRDSVEAIRAPLTQGQPTAAELLSEMGATDQQNVRRPAYPIDDNPDPPPCRVCRGEIGHHKPSCPMRDSAGERAAVKGETR